MNSAPQKRAIEYSRLPAAAPIVTPPHPVLDELIATYACQTRGLDAALSSIRVLGDVQVAVRADLLEAIDDVCTIRPACQSGVFSLNRC